MSSLSLEVLLYDPTCADVRTSDDVTHKRTNNISDTLCDCALATNCRRDDRSPIPWDERPLWFTWGVQLSILLFLIALVTALAQGQEMWWSRSLATKIQAVLSAAVYPHILQASLQTQEAWTPSALAHLAAKDAEDLSRVGFVAARCIVAPFVVGIGGYLSVQITGWQPVVAGAGAMLLAMIAVYTLSTAEQTRHTAVEEHAAIRAKQVREAVSALRSLDLLGWLKHTKASLTAEREVELDALHDLALVKHASLPTSFTLPSLAAVVTLAVYVAVPQTPARSAPNLTPQVAFPILALYIAVCQNLAVIPAGIASFARARRLTRRYTAFFAETTASNPLQTTSAGGTGAGNAGAGSGGGGAAAAAAAAAADQARVVVSCGTFAWHDAKLTRKFHEDRTYTCGGGSSGGSGGGEPSHRRHSLPMEATEDSIPWEGQDPAARAALVDIDLEVHPGDLIAIVGERGSGTRFIFSSLCLFLCYSLV